MNQKKPKILLVDDEEQNLELLEALLTPQGYEVQFAENGEKALETVAANLPDLILLDIMMPGMNGFKVLETLRAQEDSRMVPIIMLTALREKEDRLKAIKSGCDDFISKPFDKQEVQARVRALLKLNYYRASLDEKEKFEDVVNTIKDGIIVLDNKLKVSHLNTQARELLSLGAEEVTGKMFGDLYKSFLNANFDIRYSGKDIAGDLKTKNLVFDIVRPETDTRKALILEVNSHLIRNQLGELTSVILKIGNVTRSRLEKMLKQSFLGLISHKLRTPIFVINESAQLLSEKTLGEVNEKQGEILSHILDKSKQLKELIEKLLDFVDISKEGYFVTPEETEIKKQLTTIIDSWKKYRKKKVEINLACPAGLSFPLKRIFFNLIMKNLIENAVKFNDKDVVKVDLAVKPEERGLVVTVADNGPGVPPEEKENVFEQFYQVEKFFTGNVAGVGLGLALVKYLITLIGGEVSLESELDKGSTFTLVFSKE